MMDQIVEVRPGLLLQTLLHLLAAALAAAYRWKRENISLYYRATSSIKAGKERLPLSRTPLIGADVKSNWGTEDGPESYALNCVNPQV